MQNYIAYKYSGENRFYSDGKVSGGAVGVLKEITAVTAHKCGASFWCWGPLLGFNQS